MSSISGISSLQSQHIPPPPPPIQRQTATEVTNNFFSKVDPKDSGSFDKNTLSRVADKVSISQASVDAMFSLMDSNADGSVTKQEFTNLLQTIDPQSESQSTNNQAPGGMGPMHGGGPPPPPPPKPESDSDVSTTSIDPADTNGDGTVSAEEAMVYSQTASVSIDTVKSSDTMPEVRKSGYDIMMPQVMNMISSYTASENNQIDAYSSDLDT